MFRLSSHNWLSYLRNHSASHICSRKHMSRNSEQGDMNKKGFDAQGWRDNKLLIGLLGDKKAHRIIALWAADCAEHVLHLFEESLLDDERPRHAIEAGRAWIDGEISVIKARKAASAAHAAARNADNESAIAAARSAGHAAATAHVASHAIHAAEYACKAVSFLPQSESGANPMTSEIEWQLTHLRKLLEKK